MLRRIAGFIFKSKADRALDLEIADHLARETERNIARGLAPDAAARQARVVFGSIQAMKDVHRDGRGMPWLDAGVADVRYAFRQMRRAPVFTGVAVLVLAIGIGVNSADIALVDGILHPRAENIEDASRLVRVTVWPRNGVASTPASLLGEFTDFRDQQQVFSSVGATTSRGVLAGTGATRELEYAAFATGGYFATLRPRMFLGRALPLTDDRAANADPSVVISHAYWRSQFGGDTDVVGKPLIVNGVPLRVVGVLPARITGLGLGQDASHTAADLTIPFAVYPALFGDSAFMHTSSRGTGFTITARLKSNVTVEDAASAVHAIAPTCAQSRTGKRYCDNRPQVRALMALPTDEAADIFSVGAVVGVLTMLILAIACANVSILLLGRAVARRREIAIRLSLGAARRRVIRQLLTESAALAIISSGAGLLILRWMNAFIRTQFSELGTDLYPSWRTVAISVGFATGTGLLFGLLPALHATRASVAGALKDSAGSADRGRTRLQRTFVVTEVALSVMLVCVTGLFVDVARKRLGVDPGYTVSNSVLVSELPLTMSRQSALSADATLTALRTRVASLTGVEAVGLSNVMPTRSYWASHGTIEGGAAPGANATHITAQIGLSDVGYFEAVGIPVRRGRTFTGDDGPGTSPVAIISGNLAAALWPGASAIGRTITFGVLDSRMRLGIDSVFERRSVTVVGVIDSVGRGAYGDDRFLVYLHRRQVPVVTNLALVVRANQAPVVVAQRIVEELRIADPTFAFGAFKSTQQLRDERPSDLEQAGKGAAIAGLFALMLACVGLFAVVAFGVAQRSREIGIRIALGATQQQVVGRFFAEGMRLALIGFAIGVPLALGVMIVFRAQFVGITSLPAGSITAIVLSLLAVAAVASWLPARRAARVDPINSLRSE